jgi:hypothetical protein
VRHAAKLALRARRRQGRGARRHHVEIEESLRVTRLLPVLGILATASCAPRPDGCRPVGDGIALDAAVSEASGIALSRVHRDVLWTHNDSEGGAAVFAIDTEGNPIARVELAGAHNRDWEDIAVARCPAGGPEGDCFFVADIGDNRATREGVGLWIAPEPDPRERTRVDATFVRLLYPDGPRDAEALALLDDGSPIIVSKGRDQPIAVYRAPPLAWPTHGAGPVRLERVQLLTGRAVDLPLQVTGAASSDGIVALRSYSTLQFYRLESDTLAPLLAEPVILDSLGEPQGEGVAFRDARRVWLVSEAGPQEIAPRLTRLECRLP